MTCQICEMRLARDDADSEVREHLEQCPSCRAMAEELRANAAALGALRDEPLPAVAPLPRRRRAYAWIAAAAAVIVLLAVLPRVRHVEPPAPAAPAAALVPVVAPPPPPAAPKQQAHAKQQPLKIKILTPDPDVVIYWMVEGE